jgi:hypothetical protein
MATTSNSINLLDIMRKADPVSKFLADGGSWADAIELDYQLQIPVWEGQLKGAVGRFGPSAERHKARLLQHLQEAYTYLGQTGKAEARMAQFQREWEEEKGEKAKAKAAAAKAKAEAPKGGAGPKPKAPMNAWAALADSDDE